MPGYLHVSMLEPLATDNPRVLPQQSISMVTNVDDIEQHIALTESIEPSFVPSKRLTYPQVRGAP